MRSSALAAATIVLATLVLSGCGGDHSQDVLALQRRLESMDGVTKVTQTSESGDLMAGSAEFEVAMNDGSSDRELLDVLGTAYDAFDDDFGNDSTNIVVRRRYDEIALHAQRPDAERSDLTAVTRFAFDARERGEALLIDLDARDQPGHRELESTVLFDLPSRTDRADVLPRFDRIRQDDVPAHVDVKVRAGDFSALAGNDGLPSKADRQLWLRLDHGPWRKSYTVDLEPLNVAQGSGRALFVHLAVRAREDREPGGQKYPTAERDRHRVEFMLAHLKVLVASDRDFRYYVHRGPGALVQLDPGSCSGVSEQRWQAVVIRYFADHAKSCRN